MMTKKKHPIAIRPFRIEDIPQLYDIYIMPGVQEQILSIPSDRLSKSENFFGKLGENDHVFVAESVANQKIVGTASLHLNPRPRKRHTAAIGIMIHRDHQSQGVGRALMEKLIDLADNWLKLVRIELDVQADNRAAIELYKSLGFVIEGTKKYSTIKLGQYVDDYLMARYTKDI